MWCDDVYIWHVTFKGNSTWDTEKIIFLVLEIYLFSRFNVFWKLDNYIDWNCYNFVTTCHAHSISATQKFMLLTIKIGIPPTIFNSAIKTLRDVRHSFCHEIIAITCTFQLSKKISEILDLFFKINFQTSVVDIT